MNTHNKMDQLIAEVGHVATLALDIADEDTTAEEHLMVEIAKLIRDNGPVYAVSFATLLAGALADVACAWHRDGGPEPRGLLMELTAHGWKVMADRFDNDDEG